MHTIWCAKYPSLCTSKPALMAEYFRTKRARLGKVIPTTPDESDPESDPDSNSSATDEDSEMSDENADGPLI